MKENIKIIEKIIEEGNGILRLKPAWVARKHITAGRRFQLDEKDYIVFYESRGGPNRSSEVLATYLFQQADRFNNMGFASVIAMLLFFVGQMQLITENIILRKEREVS